MKKEEYIPLLPEQPEKDFLPWVRKHAGAYLGENYIVMEAERVALSPSMEMYMDNCTAGKTVWAARCYCHACTDNFITKKIKGKDGIYLSQGEDGCTYPLDPGDSEHGQDVAGITAGEEIVCPICDARGRLIHAKSLRGGRTKRIQVAELRTIGTDCAIVYWLAERTVFPYGRQYSAVPRSAYVLTQGKQIYHFSNGKTDSYGNFHREGWRWTRSTGDDWCNVYHDWGSIRNRKAGSMLFAHIPSLVGTTGEKTGLYEYWKQGGEYPIDYLRYWKKYPHIENPVNAGFGELVCELVEKQGYLLPKGILHLEYAKPHKMLGLTKEEYRAIPKSKITLEFIRELASHRAEGFTDSAVAVLKCLGNLSAMRATLAYTGEKNMDKTLRYLEKQGMDGNGISLLMDSRRYAKALHPDIPLSGEELFPRNLRETHDRLTEAYLAMQEKDKAEQYRRGFDRVRKIWGELEWTDGELCVLLPKNNRELILEGQKLRHCVGTYGKSHSQGIYIILFIRHYRRPERSYYTLNIHLGETPREIQLHGYGNERHGEHKQYEHTIPDKVRAFVNRWEKEILAPICREKFQEKEKSE